MSCLCSRTANFHDVKGQLCGPQESEMEASEPKLHTGGGGGEWWQGAHTCSGTRKAWSGQVLANNLVSE